MAPNGTMTLGDSYLESTNLSALFDTLVTRREKLSHGWNTLENVKTAYEDVVLAVDAVKELLGRLDLPP